MLTTQTRRTALEGTTGAAGCACCRRRVVVTGAAGFIASHLVDALLARGHEVVAADRRSVHDDVIAATNLAEAVEHSRLRLCRVELATENLDELMAGVDTVNVIQN